MLGNQILKNLADEGWKTVSEYSPVAFDKGIDYDHYVLRKGKLKLTFKWTNWFEWEIGGAAAEVSVIAEKYNLEAK